MDNAYFEKAKQQMLIKEKLQKALFRVKIEPEWTKYFRSVSV